MVENYSVRLQIDGVAEPRFLHVEADDAQRAAEIACEHWLKTGANKKSWAFMEVHRIDPNGNAKPAVVFSLDRQILAHKQREGAQRESVRARRRQILEESRCRAIAVARSYVPEEHLAEPELEQLRSDFERGHREYPGLEAWASVESPALLRGSGSLLFREIATRATHSSWERWLVILLGYLLENDERGEYLRKVLASSRRADEEEGSSEIYRIKKVFAASALCCAWLGTRISGNHVRKSDSLHPDRIAAKQSPGANQKAITLGNSGRKPSRRGRKYEAIDEALRKIAKAQPKRHAEVFQALDGRVSLPNAETFQKAGGWLAGFRAHQSAASAWLSKNWSRLNLPAFPRGPK